MDEIPPRHPRKTSGAGIRGYEEISHTADWALKVWATDLPSLFEEAARGMYALMGVQRSSEPPVGRPVRLSAPDVEALLVSFLDELLYFLEEGLVFDQMDLTIVDSTLAARLEGVQVAGVNKEIKAVTYHNLVIERQGDRLTATIVFDV